MRSDLDFGPVLARQSRGVPAALPTEMTDSPDYSGHRPALRPAPSVAHSVGSLRIAKNRARAGPRLWPRQPAPAWCPRSRVRLGKRARSWLQSPEFRRVAQVKRRRSIGPRPTFAARLQRPTTPAQAHRSERRRSKTPARDAPETRRSTARARPPDPGSWLRTTARAYR